MRRFPLTTKRVLANEVFRQGVFTRGGVIFYMILFNSLLAMAELTSSFESRSIILKHKHL